MRQFQATTTAIVEPQAKKFARVAHRLQAILNPKTVMAVGILLCLFDAGVIGRTLIHSDVAVVGGDFHAYLQAAHLLRAGKNPYDPAYWPSTFWFGTASVHDQYAYPPIFAQVVMVLSIPGDLFAYVVWVLLSIAAFVGSLVLLLRHFGVRLSWPWTVLIIGLALSTYPARSQVFSGQTNWVQLGLLTLGIWLYGRGRPTATGILWALVIVVKPFLILLLIYPIWKCSWRAVCSCIAAGGLITLVSFALTLGNRLDVVRGWLTASGYDSHSPFAARPDNYSMYGLLLRAFTRNPYTFPWVVSNGLLTLTSFLLIAVLAVAFVIAIPGPFASSASQAPAADAHLLVETGLVLAFVLGYGPLTEGGHLYFLLPGLVGVFMLTYDRWVHRRPTARLWLVCSALWSLALFRMALPVTVIAFVPSGFAWVQHGGPSLLWVGQIALVLLPGALVLAEILRRERALAQTLVAA